MNWKLLKNNCFHFSLSNKHCFTHTLHYLISRHLSSSSIIYPSNIFKRFIAWTWKLSLHKFPSFYTSIFMMKSILFWSNLTLQKKRPFHFGTKYYCMSCKSNCKSLKYGIPILQIATAYAAVLSIAKVLLSFHRILYSIVASISTYRSGNRSGFQFPVSKFFSFH